MTPESCDTCTWARKAMSEATARGPGITFTTERPDHRLCVRFPQPVVNHASYWCGEYLKKRD